MAISPLVLLSPRLFFASLPPSTPIRPFLEVCVQAAEADEMALKAQEALDSVVAQNALIAVDFPSQLLLGLADAELAGAGDGHTFTLSLTFVPLIFIQPNINLLAVAFGGTPTPENFLPEFWGFEFSLAGTAADLADQYSPMAQRLVDKSPGNDFEEALVIYNMSAGAAKGTRLMNAIGGFIDFPPLPRGNAPTKSSPALDKLMKLKDKLKFDQGWPTSSASKTEATATAPIKARTAAGAPFLGRLGGKPTP
jgi:hypothetical protein